MTYIEAVKYRDEHIHLIGTKTDKGMLIDSLVIVPTEEKRQELFWQSYLFLRDANKAIAPFTMFDMTVWAVNTNLIFQRNFLMYKDITNP